jgi:hypothetical protein
LVLKYKGFTLLPSTREVRDAGREGMGRSKELLRARKVREEGRESTARSKAWGRDNWSKRQKKEGSAINSLAPVGVAGMNGTSCFCKTAGVSNATAKKMRTWERTLYMKFKGGSLLTVCWKWNPRWWGEGGVRERGRDKNTFLKLKFFFHIFGKY